MIQQFHPGELGGLALAEIVFGDANPSGKLPVSFPRSVGTTPVFYNYLKGARFVDAGEVFDNGTLLFGHQVCLHVPGIKTCLADIVRSTSLTVRSLYGASVTA